MPATSGPYLTLGMNLVWRVARRKREATAQVFNGAAVPSQPALCLILILGPQAPRHQSWIYSSMNVTWAHDVYRVPLDHSR